jgi:hypothetical protein
VQVNPAGFNFIGCDYDPRGRGESRPGTQWLDGLATPFLAAPSLIDGPVRGWNLRGKNVPVAGGLASVAIQFHPGFGAGQAALSRPCSCPS